MRAHRRRGRRLKSPQELAPRVVRIGRDRAAAPCVGPRQRADERVRHRRAARGRPMAPLAATVMGIVGCPVIIVDGGLGRRRRNHPSERRIALPRGRHKQLQRMPAARTTSQRSVRQDGECGDGGGEKLHARRPRSGGIKAWFLLIIVGHQRPRVHRTAPARRQMPHIHIIPRPSRPVGRSARKESLRAPVGVFGPSPPTPGGSLPAPAGALAGSLFHPETRAFL